MPFERNCRIFTWQVIENIVLQSMREKQRRGREGGREEREEVKRGRVERESGEGKRGGEGEATTILIKIL